MTTNDDTQRGADGGAGRDAEICGVQWVYGRTDSSLFAPCVEEIERLTARAEAAERERDALYTLVETADESYGEWNAVAGVVDEDSDMATLAWERFTDDWHKVYDHVWRVKNGLPTRTPEPTP